MTSYADGSIEPGHLYEYEVTSFNGERESDVVGSIVFSVDCTTPVIGTRGRPVRRGPRPCTQ